MPRLALMVRHIVMAVSVTATAYIMALNRIEGWG